MSLKMAITYTKKTLRKYSKLKRGDMFYEDCFRSHKKVRGGQWQLSAVLLFPDHIKASNCLCLASC